MVVSLINGNQKPEDIVAFDLNGHFADSEVLVCTFSEAVLYLTVGKGFHAQTFSTAS